MTTATTPKTEQLADSIATAIKAWTEHRLDERDAKLVRNLQACTAALAGRAESRKEFDELRQRVARLSEHCARLETRLQAVERRK